MSGRLKIIFLIFVAALATKYGAHGFIEQQVIDLVSYGTTENPLVIAKYHDKYMKHTEKNLESLIKNNPDLERLMRKARGLLQIRLLQWADVIGQMALIDQQLSQYVRNAQRDPEGESELLLDYAMWIVSHDHTAVTGLLEEMRKLVRPLFTSQGVLKLATKFMDCNNFFKIVPYLELASALLGPFRKRISNKMAD